MRFFQSAMLQNRSIQVVLVFLSFLALAGLATPLRAANWDVVSLGGRNYVTVESIGNFYRLGSPTPAGKGFKLQAGRVSINGDNGSTELFINGRKFVLSFPIMTDSKGDYVISQMDVAKLLEPVMRPNRIKGAGRVKTVVLDPGHGAHDQGATSRYGNEKTMALDTARRVKKLLQKRGYKVVMTRDSDTFIPLQTRAAIANQYKDAIFLAIHYNSGGSTSSGIEVYCMAPQGTSSSNDSGGAPSMARVPYPGNANDSLNVAMATTMQNSILRVTGLPDRGVRRARFRVLRDIKVPGVLIECGFLSNPTEARKIATTSYRNGLAEAIARSVDVYQAATGARSYDAAER